MPTALDKSGTKIVRRLYIRRQRIAHALSTSLAKWPTTTALLRDRAKAYCRTLFHNSKVPIPHALSLASSQSGDGGGSGGGGDPANSSIWVLKPETINRALQQWWSGYSPRVLFRLYEIQQDLLDTPHPQIPGGVVAPPGLTYAARKFHSYTIARHPAVPAGEVSVGSDNGSSLPPAKSSLPDNSNTNSLPWGSTIPAHPAPSTASSFPSTPSSSHLGFDRKSKPVSYMFSHSAAGIPKNTGKIPLTRARRLLLQRDERELSTSSGEDAFFHRNDALGVADGVGGWASDVNADAGLFARRLMHHAHEEIARYDDIDDEMFVRYSEASPVDILRTAYEKTLEEFGELKLKGSSTACIVLLRDDELRVANLGDCGLTVVRQGDMIFRTEEQQHSFNYPYQLGTGEHSDKPTDAQIFRLKVRRGDIIIVGTDGLFDNLFDEDILEEVNRLLPPTLRGSGEPQMRVRHDSGYESSHSRSPRSEDSSSLKVVCSKDMPVTEGVAAVVAARVGDKQQGAGGRARLGFSLPQFHVDPKAISDAIAYRAKFVSEENRYISSPFQTRAIQEGLYYQGGKKDDISVIVAIITDLEDSPDRR